MRDTLPAFQAAVAAGSDPWLAWITQNREVQRTMSVNFKDVGLRTTLRLTGLRLNAPTATT